MSRVRIKSNSDPLHVVVDSMPAGGSGLTDTELRASPVPVSGTVTVVDGGGSLTVDGVFFQAAQPVTDNGGSLTVDGTFFQATQPISAAALPLPSGASTSALQLPNGHDVTVDNAAGASAVNIQDGGNSITIDGTVTANLAAGTNNIGDVDIASIAAGNNNIGDVDVATIAAGTNRIGSVRLVDSADADLTNVVGTQTSRFVGVQRSIDAGRTEVRYYATGAASGTTTTETTITLTRSSGTAATTTGTSFVLTTGKRYRITNLTVASQGHTTGTVQTSTFNLRINTAGAVVVGSTPLILSARTSTPATSLAWDRFTIPLGEGLELLGNGTIQFGITANAVFVTNAPTWNVIIIGYEY